MRANAASSDALYFPYVHFGRHRRPQFPQACSAIGNCRDCRPRASCPGTPRPLQGLTQPASAPPQKPDPSCCVAEDARLVPTRDSCTAAFDRYDELLYSITSSARERREGGGWNREAYGIGCFQVDDV